MSLRLLLTGGGTGGHVYPLLAVKAAMQTNGNDWLFVGGNGLEKELVARAAVPYQAISGGGLHGVGIAQAVPSLVRLSRGLFQAIGILRRFRPQAILATGGFITIPVAIAASWARIPLVVYLPDIEPAASVKFIGRMARRITATAGTSGRYFSSGKLVETGYPLRRELLAAAQLSQAAARAQFGLAADQPVVLVFGGSRGARSLNRAVSAAAQTLLAATQLIHISGTGEWDEVSAERAKLPAKLQTRYQAFPYLHEDMGAAMAAADLVVSRSGASALGEFPMFGLPGILVPYPYAWRYQKVNADYLTDRGAAVIVKDDALLQDLGPTVMRLLHDNDVRRAMGERAKALARPQAAEAIAEVVREVAKAA